MLRWLFIIYLTCSAGCIITTDDSPSGGVIHGDDSYSSMTIWNDSSYVIEEIYLSPSDNRHWGPDLLGHDVLYEGEKITIDYLECDYYDVMVVDEYHAECILDDIDLCFDDELWRISDRTLEHCQ